MNRSDSPAKQSKPFGINGPREAILPTTPSGDNTASYESGFPPITMTLKSAGGLPPKGQDMNQILFELSALGRWASSGAMNTFDSAFATAIGGYPTGAYVLGSDLKTVYRCTADGNTNNPNSIPTGWAKVANDIADILGLGTAAIKNVGTGAGQIPDMSSFPSGTNYFKMPGGKIVQFGIISFGIGVNQVVVNYPVAFPSAVRSIVLTWTDAAAASGASSTGLWYAVVKNTPTAPLNQFTAWLSGAGGFNLSYIAIGE